MKIAKYLISALAVISLFLCAFLWHRDCCCYDAVYVITSGDKKCLDSLSSQLKRNSVDFKQFNVTDNKKLVFENLSTGKVYKLSDLANNKANHMKENAFYRVGFEGDPLSDHSFNFIGPLNKIDIREIKRAINHRAVWKDVKTNRYKKVVVFEDNIKLTKEIFKANFVSALSNVPNDADIAFLGTGRAPEKHGDFIDIERILREYKKIKGNDCFVKVGKANQLFGIYGYVVNEKGANNLLKATSCMSDNIDTEVFSFNIKKGSYVLNVYLYKFLLLKPIEGFIKVRKYVEYTGVEE